MSPLFTKESGIDSETVLDVTVNAIPLGMLLFFEVLFLVVNPWGWDLEYVFWMHLLTLVPFTLLTLLTYVSARVISRDEAALEGSTGDDDPAH